MGMLGALQMITTRILRVDQRSPDLSLIRDAGRAIRDDGLVAFPTETVYGLGGNAFSEMAVERIFQAKGRPLDNPVIVHIADDAQLKAVAESVPKVAKRLIETFWPGPLTLVLKKNDRVPSVTTAGLETVAVRMPSHSVAQLLIREAGTPIGAPSANISGSPSPTKFQHVFKDLYGKIDVIIDGGNTPVGLESTVVDVTLSPPTVLRIGAVTLERVKRVVQDVTLHPTVGSSLTLGEGPAKSPGTKHKHYAPRTKMILVQGSPRIVRNKIESMAREFVESDLKVGVLAVRGTYHATRVRRLGDGRTMKSVAKDLFSGLRDLDEMNLDVILAEGVKERGLGLAIMDRLKRASGGNIIRT